MLTYPAKYTKLTPGCRLNGPSYLDHSDAESPHSVHRASILQLAGRLGVQLDLLLLLGGSDPQEVLRQLPDVHLETRHTAEDEAGQAPNTTNKKAWNQN